MPFVALAASPVLAVISVLDAFLAALIASTTFLAVATPSVVGPVIVPSAPAVIAAVFTSYFTTPSLSTDAVVKVPFTKSRPLDKDTFFALASATLLARYVKSVLVANFVVSMPIA